ncbi:MAG: YceI family protein [Deltaproteobacteria bacterium]|nr:YceI family protein [Deltaproteobacteria bacterium]
MTARRPALALALLLATSLTACNDPAEGKPAAKTEAAASATPPAAPATTGAPAPAAAAAAIPEGAVAFDQRAGTIQWVGSKVTGSHLGGFERFHGWIQHDPGSGSYAFEVVIDMASVTSDSGGLTRHLQSGDFFLVSEHPTATFRTTEPILPSEGKATVVGELTLRGVTKKLSFPAEISVREDGYTFKSEFTLERFDWGVAYEGAADDLIRNAVVVKLAFESTL